MDWRIDTCALGDENALALIGAATFLETFAGILDGTAIVAHCQRQHSPDTYAGYLAKGASAWLAKLDPGGAPIGFALLTAPDLPGAALDGSDIELKRIYALSRFHGAGVGKALMDIARSTAVIAGANRLLLGVYKSNHRAIAFYKKSGFVEIGERQFQVGDKIYDDLVLAAPL